MKLRHIIIIALFVLINVLVLSTLNFRKDEEPEAGQKEKFVQTLEAQKIMNGTQQFEVSGFGTVSSFNFADISCEVQGKLMQGRKELKPGVRFKKGETIFYIDDAEARFNLNARKSGFINLIAQILPDIKVDFPDELSKWNAYIENIDIDKNLPEFPKTNSTKEKVFISTKGILSEYYGIKSLEVQLRKFSVQAPFSGTVSQVFVSNQSVVNPGTKVLTLAQSASFEIAVSLPAATLSSLRIGTTANIFSTGGELRGKGKVVRISEVINKSTQSVDVYVKPESLDGSKFIEGEYVKVAIEETGEFNGCRVPLAAVLMNEVFLYSKKDSTLTRKKIAVLDENEQGVFISGLADQDILIIQEVLNYTDSTKYGVLVR